MHYLDDEQVKENALDVVIYVHESSGDLDNRYYELASIQKCQYVDVNDLKDFLDCFNQFCRENKEISALKTEEWWLVELKNEEGEAFTSDPFNFIISKITNVSESDNQFHKLH